LADDSRQDNPDLSHHFLNCRFVKKNAIGLWLMKLPLLFAIVAFAVSAFAQQQDDQK
jgi:hypothetical protein